MSECPIHYLGLSEVSERIRTRKLTSLEVTELLIARIEKLNPQINGVLRLLSDTARAQAVQADREIDAGFWRGPLHGVPIGLKDVIWTKGLPTSSGMASRLDFEYPEDATLIEKVRDAGAVLLAKLHMTEGANFDHDPKLPRPSNPWSDQHWVGISSSGAGVSVAAGFVYAAIATDSGGSIRMPAAANGVTGLKPTTGRVSRHGVYHSCESFDTVGVMARSAGDAAILLQVLSGRDVKDPTTLSDLVPDYSARINEDLRGLKIGIDWQYATEDIDEAVVSALNDALKTFKDLGAQVQEVCIPWGLEQALTTMNWIVAELNKSAQDHFPELNRDTTLTGRNQGSGVSATDVVKGYLEGARFRGEMDCIFRNVDLLLLPGLGEVVPTWSEVINIGNDLERLLGRFTRFTVAFNIAGVPTISLPGGFTSDGLPIGIQLIAPRLHEADLVRAGAAFQRETDFHRRRPPLGC